MTLPNKVSASNRLYTTSKDKTKFDLPLVTTSDPSFDHSPEITYRDEASMNQTEKSYLTATRNLRNLNCDK